MVVVEPRKGFDLRLKELWNYRELLFILVWRELKSATSRQPLGHLGYFATSFGTVVFSIFFGRLPRFLPTYPYPVFAYVGLLPWQLSLTL